MTRKPVHNLQNETASLSLQTTQSDVVPESGPCDDCQQAITCANRHLACMAFFQYVRTGRWDTATPRGATRSCYLRLFCGDKNEGSTRLTAADESPINSSCSGPSRSRPPPVGASCALDIGANHG